jgi:hypothetical protein
MTLLPGDLMCCGTSIGVGVMKEPINTVTVAIRRHRRTAQRVSAVTRIRNDAGLQIACRIPAISAWNRRGHFPGATAS